MRPEISRLVDLQALDLRLSELRAKLTAIPVQLAAVEKAVADSRQQVTAAKEALTSSLKERKNYEMDVDSWKEKAKKYRDQSFAVKTNDAYKALQHEIQHAETQVAQAEDRLLERMVSGEEFERQVKAAERAVISVEAETKAEKQKIEAERAVLEAEATAKQKERKEIVAGIPESLLTTYSQVAERRHGIAMAAIRDEACTQCGVRIRPHVFQELRRPDSQEIFQCETCNRILYYVEPAGAPNGSAESAAAASISVTE